VSIGDKAGIEAVKHLTDVTLPKLSDALHKLAEKLDMKLDEDLAQAVNDAHELLDRLNGAKVTLSIPERKSKIELNSIEL
jgi:putative aminopeptidase FrvX